MMKFIPNSCIKDEMLKILGYNNINDLFDDIPSSIRIDNLNISSSKSQQEVEYHLRRIASKNRTYYDTPCFIGGGQPHYVPSVVKSILSRSEFYTAYTPYQPEASQGFLQAMFEYQSMITELTGMDISNASLYDGATALGEAALMSHRINKKPVFLISECVSHEKKSVLRNYTKGAGITIREVPYNEEEGTVDIDALSGMISSEVSGVYIENPNFFGIFEEDAEEVGKIVHDNESLFIVGVDPFTLGIVKKPGEYNADIVIGEGRGLGTTMELGGCGLGIFSCKNEFLRQIPGRIIGMSKDSNGKRAFCMTMQTREQHIRREKATSNICTNEGLCALAAVVYLAWLGEEGLEEIGRINLERGHMLSDSISSINGFERVFRGVHFNEFVMRYKDDPHVLNKNLLKHGFQGGLILSSFNPDFDNCLLFGVSEIQTDDQITGFLKTLREVA
ncbi:MAG: aminomethyl-transferring glycine dehydrogenase subunit GcvPA [Candidatus Thermoplasmatota archaeon]